MLGDTQTPGDRKTSDTSLANALPRHGGLTSRLLLFRATIVCECARNRPRRHAFRATAG